MTQGTESERDSRSSEPHSFVNHYANVNSTFRQSWKKQKAVAVPPPRTAASSGGASASQAGTMRASATLKSQTASTSAGAGLATGGAGHLGPGHPLASTNPRGYSSFTESSDQVKSWYFLSLLVLISATLGIPRLYQVQNGPCFGCTTKPDHFINIIISIQFDDRKHLVAIEGLVKVRPLNGLAAKF